MAASSDDDLPDLLTLLAPHHPSASVRRQSPRKVKPSRPLSVENDLTWNVSILSKQKQVNPRKPGPPKASLAKAVSFSKAPMISLSDVPVLPRYGPRTETSASSRNGPARSPYQRSIGLTQVDSLLSPLSKICLDGQAQPRPSNFKTKGVATSTRAKQSEDCSDNTRRKPTRTATRASKFIDNEAACWDNSENSLIYEEEDEDTDLSGFIVDDDAELSIYESSSESELNRRAKKETSVSPRKRRLQQGSRCKKTLETLWLDVDPEKEKKSSDSLTSMFQNLGLGSTEEKSQKKAIEIVDLTSPARTRTGPNRGKPNKVGDLSRSTTSNKEPTDLFNDFDAILKFSPPCSSNPAVLPTNADPCYLTSQAAGMSNEDAEVVGIHVKDGFNTPPDTPPRSPSKLKSPSKLFSPSKGAAQIPESPHRQSLEGFWDLEVVNAWNDEYSPNKASLASPKKNRFLQWMGLEDEEEQTPKGILNDSSDSLPSPCSSPRKGNSPQRSPKKAEKQRLLEEKRAAKAKKQDFELRRTQLANILIKDLDTNITASKISALSASTGGVQIIWSKTLRSTAGRANWRRTVIKATGSPVKESSISDSDKVQHYASIDLAAKVVDSEHRLVNTVAHEFCHLANFMISGVRDQPHGASFKAWAMKVTQYLRAHENPMYRGVEVTTKHSYAIDHKYLWICAGRDSLLLFRDMPDTEDGCGAEYGRHSKSIDPDKHRCGRCKGLLVQVRPKPRKVDPKRSSPRKAPFQKEKSLVETITEEVEFVDLSD